MIIENPVYTFLTEKEAILEIQAGRPVIAVKEGYSLDCDSYCNYVTVTTDHVVHTLHDLYHWLELFTPIRKPLTAEQLIDSGIHLVATSGSCIKIISSTTKPSIYDKNTYYTSESTEHYLKEDLVFQHYGDSLSYCTVESNKIIKVKR